MTTHVLIPGTFNSRDLGGVATADGTVRPRTVIRSDAIAHLSAPGRSALRALGVRSAIDLREAVERGLDPADLTGTGVRLLERPVLGEGFMVARDWGLDRIYRLLLTERGAAMTAVIRLLATPGTLPAVVFCSAGKDRTGLISMLTLAAAGASEEAIVADYALTERNMHGAFRETLIARAAAAGIGEQEVAVKVSSTPALMRDTLDWLRAEHGGPVDFLRTHGMTESELDALRSALVVPRAAAAA